MSSSAATNPTSEVKEATASVTTTATVPASTTATTKKPRRTVSSETVVAAFDQLEKLVTDHIETLRQQAAQAPAKSGSTGIKFLRTVNSRLKWIKKDATKVMEASKKRPRRQAKADGGFLKPHRVAKEMADFAGWEKDAMKSRVDITNCICEYVKSHSLQDPNKRKNILPDEKLKKLLDYDPNVAGNDPLTYFYLQKLIGKLQVKEVAPEK